MESNQESSIIPAISSSSSRIFEDLIPDILKWLPAKSLCRFQCVSESWYGLILSSSFIQLHYKTTSSATPPHLKSYLRCKRVEDGIWYDDYALCRPQDDHIRRPLFFPFRFPSASNKNGDDLHFVDLIHGVVCLSYSLECEQLLDDTIILWNPATHFYMVSSTANFILDEFRYHHSMGFGYDPCTDDFIVVRIWYDSYSELCRSLVYQVYSARQDLWIEKFDDDIQFRQTTFWKGRFVNGSIHWLVAKYGDYSLYVGGLFVIVFDCELQEFTTMELPQPIIDNEVRYCIELLDYCGMLSVLGSCDGHLELWVMEDTTWKKLYAFSRDTELNAVDIYHSSYLKMAPYGPNEWIKFRWNGDLFGDIVNHYVYDESIMLADQILQYGYKNEEIVHIHDRLHFLQKRGD